MLAVQQFFCIVFLPSRWRFYTQLLEMSLAFPAGSSCSGDQGAGREVGSLNEKAQGSLQKAVAPLTLIRLQ